MKRSIPLRTLVAAVAVAVAFGVPHGAQAGPSEPSVPTTIEVPEGHKLFLVTNAVGVQIHACTTAEAGHRWSFVAPRADLVDAHGKSRVSHFAGPSWQARDGSLVKAALDKRVSVDPTAIDWLLLRVTHAAVGADGDWLADTTFIQRLATTGGLAPAAASCNAGTVGAVEEVPYTAVYAFWKKAGR